MEARSLLGRAFVVFRASLVLRVRHNAEPGAGASRS